MIAILKIEPFGSPAEGYTRRQFTCDRVLFFGDGSLTLEGKRLKRCLAMKIPWLRWMEKGTLNTQVVVEATTVMWPYRYDQTGGSLLATRGLRWTAVRVRFPDDATHSASQKLAVASTHPIIKEDVDHLCAVPLVIAVEVTGPCSLLVTHEPEVDTNILKKVILSTLVY